ncbi:MAG: PIN domain-containing protein [Chloroflexales bacterium]
MSGDASRLCVDTNILIYATNSASVWHTLATTRLQALRHQGAVLVLSQQIVREYMAVAARMRDIAGGLTTAEILENIGVFRTEFMVLDDTPGVLDQLVTLLRSIPVADRRVHDANIVATMLVHGVRRLLTHNIGDFARYAHLITVLPLVLPAPIPSDVAEITPDG